MKGSCGYPVTQNNGPLRRDGTNGPDDRVDADRSKH